jgi:DNA-directed RNA polymerase subunit K/omega
MVYTRGAGEKKDPSATTGSANCEARDNSSTVQTRPRGSWQKVKEGFFMEPVSVPIKIPARVKNTFLEAAQMRIPSPELLVNVVRLRVRQLVQGHRPLTQTSPWMEFADIALKEISEGKLGYAFPEEAELVPEAPAVIVADPLANVA